ncbi:hypothetical protein U1Q18_020692 [Sarracenia purpurea var. burkii]
MAENGEEKLIAVAREIAKTLGHTETMAGDILQIFSNFDGRLREKLSEKLSDEDPRTLEQILKSLDRDICRYVSADHPIWSESADSSAFLDVVDELLSAIRDWTPMVGNVAVAACLDRADGLLRRAMFRLGNEFTLLMERGGESFDPSLVHDGESAAKYSFDSEEDEGHHVPVAHPVVDYDIVIEALPPETINDLHEIAKRMVAAGYGHECSHVYSGRRRDFLEESLSRLGLQKLTIDEVQKMAWCDLEDEIERWIKAANVALRILFPSERRLCDRVFFGFSSTADFSFMEVCKGSTVQLLNFSDAIAIGSRAPERLFKVLDIFETFRDLMPRFEGLFSDQYCLFLRKEAFTIWKRLGEAIRGIFMELVNLIRRDPAKEAVPGGGLHPITRYVMNYLRAACRSQKTLGKIFEDTMPPSPSLSSLSVQMAQIMELLHSNLESKSNIYGDSSLCSIFMMNNGRYIVQKVEDSELGPLLGDDWIRKHKAKVRQYHLNYQRSSWSKALGVLKLDNSSSLASNGGSNALKEKLNLFNMYMDDISRTQTTWIIHDEQLREELRASVAENLLPSYRNFLRRFQNLRELEEKHEKHIRYSEKKLESLVDELFRGSIGLSAGGRK